MSYMFHKKTLVADLHSICLRLNIVQDMADAQQILFGDRSDPWILLHLQHGLVAAQLEAG